MQENATRLSLVKEFASKLPLINDSRLRSPILDLLPLASLGAAIALNRYITLNIKIYYASRSLVKAFDTEHQELWGKAMEDPLIIRSMYFENAVEDYNKVCDYVYQILYFNFHLYEKLDNRNIESQNDVIELARNIQGDKLQKVKDFLSVEHEEFYRQFTRYEADIRNTRELANDIKHRGCYAIKGVVNFSFGTAYRNSNGEEVNLTELAAPKLIDLDSEITKLVEVHNKTYLLLKSLYNVCGFESTLDNFLTQSR